LARRLEAVLGAFASLAAAEPLPAGDGHLQDAAPMRPDVVDAVLAPSTVLAVGQHVAADCFVVPRVVEG
jgi:Asp-tRNA(Asn)/Glu-tRNA(Gln) amidotransferase C subunit